MEQERMLPILLDMLDTNSDMELRPLTGLLRNLARHSSNKDHMGRTPSMSRLLPVCFGLRQRWTSPTLTLVKGLIYETPTLFLCPCSYKYGESSGVKTAE